VARGCRAGGRSVVFLRLAKVLELLQSIELVLGEVSYVAGWILVGWLELWWYGGALRAFVPTW
jgi:hypothetical protein